MSDVSVNALIERWNLLDAKATGRMRAVASVGARLFGEKGYQNVTMEDIAAESGISKGGIYYYFKSKTEILFFVVNTTIDDLLRGLPEELSIEPLARERVHMLMRRQLDYYYGHLHEVQTLLNDRKLLTRDFMRLVDLKEQRYFRIVEAQIADLVPGTDPGRLAALTFAFFGLCNWIPSWYRLDGPLSIDEICDVNFQLFIHGLSSFGSPGERATTTSADGPAA